MMTSREAAIQALTELNPRFALYREQDPAFREKEIEFWTKHLSEAEERGVISVLLIRCIEHRNIPQLNRNEITGAECPVCEIEKMRQTLERIANEIPNTPWGWAAADALKK